MSAGAPIAFTKGHGTENDFVVVPDRDGLIDLDAATVVALCDRRTGIGADGVLRLAPATDHDGDTGDARWFMDYRNADGSIAETCGNGLRVAGRWLVANGWERPGDILLATRAGVRALTVPADPAADVTASMGRAAWLPGSEVGVGTQTWKATGVDMGNPHLVVLEVAALEPLDLTTSPSYDEEAFPHGANVELVATVDERHVRMRVWERGVGETRSCGSGACAAAVAHLDRAGLRGDCVVDVPGGRLVVGWDEDGNVTLRGPAVLVASGTVEPANIGVRAAAAR